MGVSASRQMLCDLLHTKAALGHRHDELERSLVIELDGPSVEIEEEDHRREPRQALVAVNQCSSAAALSPDPG